MLEQLALAPSNAEIAAHLRISVRTVESHLSTIYGKLGVHGRLEALRYALEAAMTREPKHRREDGAGNAHDDSGEDIYAGLLRRGR